MYTISKANNLPQCVNKITDEEIGTAFEKFLKIRVGAGAASRFTIRNYRLGMQDYMQWCYDHQLQPLGATEDSVREYRKALIDAGFAPTYVALKLQAVRRLYESLIAAGFAQGNPAVNVVAPRDSTEAADKVKFLTEEAFKEVLLGVDTTNETGKRDYAALVLMGIHGLRACEVCALTAEDVSILDRHMQVFGKGRKIRKVYLTHKTAAALNAHMATCVAEGVNKLFGMTTRTLERIVDRYFVAAGVKRRGLGCHALRHTAATLALAKGASLTSIRDNLGHSSIQTTEIYAKVLDKRRANPAELLEGLL